jgi:hypothetical protein
MRRHHFQSATLKVLLVPVLVLVLLLEGVMHASASRNTEVRCDIDVKYWCSYVTYDAFWDGNLGTYWYPVWDRWYRGGVDGGAIFWELEFAHDYRWNGSYWEIMRSAGPYGIYTNVPLSGWYTDGTDYWLEGGGLVEMRHRFRECSPCYYWHGDLVYHFLD